MNANNTNPLNDLAELLFRDARPNHNGARDLSFELRFGEIQIVEGQYVFSVKAEKAFLSLQCEGLTIEPGSRLGDFTKEPTETVTRTIDRKETVSKKASISLSVDPSQPIPANVRGEVAAAAESSQTASQEKIQKLISRRIAPRGGDKWEFSEPENEPLDGKYLDEKMVLCRLAEKVGANRRSLEAWVRIRQRDLVIEQDGRFYSRLLSVNQSKLLKIVLARAINSQATSGTRAFDGSVVVSYSAADV